MSGIGWEKQMAFDVAMSMVHKELPRMRARCFICVPPDVDALYRPNCTPTIASVL
jgi:hypothetical protein